MAITIGIIHNCLCSVKFFYFLSFVVTAYFPLTKNLTHNIILWKKGDLRSMKGKSIDLNFIIGVFLKSLVWIIVAAIVGAIGGYMYTARTSTSSYTASVQFVALTDEKALYKDEDVSDEEDSGTVNVQGVTEVAYSMRLISTYMVLLKSNEAAKYVVEEIKANDGYRDEAPAAPLEAEPAALSYDWLNWISPSTVRNAISFKSYEDTNIFEATITTNNFYLTEAISHGLAEAASTAIVNIYNVGAVNAFERSAAPYQSTVDYVLPTAIGSVLLAALVFACFLLVNFLDDTVKNEAEIAGLGMLFLGTVPDINPNDKNETGVYYSRKRKKSK